ncbi:hypothetical protein V1264_006629 [Littorina saxatilis]|uniref:Calponin-homology (CH) domain-containing protein n=1 Tax=Littorina saxatilis TaxID=31220 RepID=A0AAN9AZU7_9CAEN
MATPGASPFVAMPLSAQRRSARRSWFDTPPATKLELAVEQPPSPMKTMNSRSKRRSIDDVETLVLTHFTKPPRISFGKIIVGRSKTRILLVQNPAEYEQEVVIERFPHKKGFNVDQTHFVVGPEEVVSLTLTWMPHEAGGCREMVLFHVNDVYRLQAFLFGTADDPKPVRKGRKGMLGARKMQALTCVMQTKSLKNIQDSYSPRRSVELRELRSQVKPTHALHFDQENMQPPDLEEVIPQTPPPLESTAICKSDDRNDQKALERRKSGFLSKMSPIPRMTDTNNGIMESYAQFQTPVFDGKGEERSPLKAMSGNDHGMRISNSPNKHGNRKGGENSRDSSQTSKQRGESRNKSSGSRDNSQTGQKSDTSSKDKPGKASLRREIPAVREAKMHVSPNSFLNDSMAAQTVATPEVGQIRLSTQVTRVAALAKVSPSSFLEDMGSAKAEAVARKQSIPSPSSVLNDSIPHDIMVRQLEFVRRSLHEGSFSGVPTPTSSAGVKERAVSKQPPRPMKMDRVSELARPKKRNVFANAQQQNGPAKKEKFLQRKIHERARFAKITDAPSPRRKTFLVKKQPAGKVSPVKGRLQSTTGRKDAGKGVTRQVTHNHQNAKPKALTKTSSLMTTAGETEIKEKVEDSEHPCITTATSSHDDEANNLDDTMTRKRRSLWASPAVVGFEPHIMESRPDCDSTGEETQTRENTPAQMSKDEMSLQGDSLLLLCHPHLQVQSDANKSHGHQNSPDKTTAATNNRQSSGRRLFPDVCEDLSQSSDFKPLWAGTATVTKDRPSISPHLSGSGNTSKKLFPDISVDNGSGATSYTTPVQSDTKGNSNIKHDSLSSTTGDHEREQRHSSDNKNKAVCSENAPQSGGGHSFEFSSTPQLIDSPASGSEASRRATLTVTKSHASKALLESSSNSQVEKVVPEVKVNLVEEEEEEEEEVWHTDTVVIDTRNSVIVGVKIMTPSRLPTTPTSENYRRSTHAIRNPVVLDKDGLIPKNLFPAVAETNGSDMQQGDKLGDTWTETAKDAAEASSIAQNDREQNDTHISQKDLPVAAADQRLSVSSVFTERVEHHLQSDRITVTRSTAKFAAVVIVPDDSVSSLEISGDSLETGKRTSISRGEADITDDKDDDASQRVRSEESWYDDDLVIPENSDAQSQRTERSLSTGNVSEETRLGSPTDQTDSSFPEVTPFPSSTAVGSEVKVVCPSKPEATNPDSPDRTPDAKLTTAQPTLSHTIVKETLLKDAELSQTRTAVASSSHAENSNNQHRSSSQGQSQGQLRKSLSAEFRSKASHPPKAVKPPASFNVGSTKLSNQRTRSVSAIHTQGQTITKTRSQSSLDPEKLPERLGKKRSSPEAGLKEPRSKRVELDSTKKAGKSQQPPSRAIGKTRAERPVKRTKGVPLSKLILVKKLKTALPKHPLPFAAKNMYYDERWQDKQERGFVHWLNFVLTPADEYALATTKAKVDARSIAFDGSAVKAAPRLAPTKEVLSFRAYTARRRLNHLRRASCRLFQSEAVVRVVCRLELEVEQRRLAVRTDRMIHADIGIKQKILDMLLSYNPLWLRIGLETVYGEVLPVQSNNDVIGMSRFILTRLLTNPDISAQFSHATVPHLYHDGYADAVAQHTMKKFLVLVYLLDCAKQSRLIAHDPCLFCKDAEIKSSKGMLTQFSRDYLSGEGDITKHLAYMGYVVTHVQTPLDEFDYAVTNLCTDLRDGLRLGRIVMLLSGDWSFASSLRAPAISRLQKIHNVELVFKQLTQRGFDLNTAKGGTLNARDIVDGHREKTLAFLWKLIFLFQTMAMLNEDELQEEVDMLERTLRVKLCMQRLLSRTHLTETLARRDSGGVTVAMDNPLTQLLLKWCRTVCLHYGVKVTTATRLQH